MLTLSSHPNIFIPTDVYSSHATAIKYTDIVNSGFDAIPDAKSMIDSEPESTVLVVLPLTRLLLRNSFTVGKYYFFPEGEFDISCLCPNKNLELQDVHSSGATRVGGQTLREVTSSFTGFDTKVLETNPLVIFAANLDWNEFETKHNHQDDIELIRRFSYQVEKALDVVRFRFCRLDLPDTLPGVPGSWYGSEDYLGMMVYSGLKLQSYLYAGSAIECSVVIKGLGLELDNIFHEILLIPKTDHVSAIASHGLSLLSDSMASPNETVKFTRIMTLLEYLASPYEYKQWKKIKGLVASYSATNKNKYFEILERFTYLTSRIEDGAQVGLRTLIIHQGQNIQNLIPSRQERNELFGELQNYASHMLSDMIQHEEMSWSDYSGLRESLKADLIS